MRARFSLWLVLFLCFAVTGRGQFLILHGNGGSAATYVTDVENKLLGSGLLGATLSIYNANLNPAPTLGFIQQFQAILVFTDSGGFQDSVGVGNVLADYVDAGGNVVEAVFANGSIPISGRWLEQGYSPFNPGGQTASPALSLGTVLLPDHPVMAGVMTFTDSSSYRSTGTLREGAIRIADWSNGEPLIVERTGLNGLVLSLNFYPPSSNALAGLWDPTTDGAKILANSLNYVATVPEPSTWALMILGGGWLAIVASRRRR